MQRRAGQQGSTAQTRPGFVLYSIYLLAQDGYLKWISGGELIKKGSMASRSAHQSNSKGRMRETKPQTPLDEWRTGNLVNCER